MIHCLYRVLTVIGGPLINRYLERRMARGKEDPERFGERLGHPGLPRPAGALAWLHAASVGEALSLLPLAEVLAGRPGLSLLMTTGTVTSARLMSERLPAGAVHQYIPVDRPAYVRRFLDHWQPDLALWAESDFWPNLLAESRKRAIPIVLVQGRVSAKSYAAWSRVPGFIRKLLGSFALCMAQTEDDAERLKSLGAGRVVCLGNLKLAVPPLPHDPAELDRLQQAVGLRPLWCFGSTHPGEDAMAGRIHLGLEPNHPGLLTMVVPRHPIRGPDIAAELTALGLRVSRRSAGELPSPQTQIWIADTMGELGLVYRLSPIVCMGKSFTAEGGQNPFEPARLGAAVLFGPRMSNFPDMAPAMAAAGAAEEVADETSLSHALIRLLSQPEVLAQRRAAALEWSRGEAGALETVAAALAPFLAAAEARHACS